MNRRSLFSRILVVVCCVLAVAPGQAWAKTSGSFHSGLGAVGSNCEYAEEVDKDVCLAGARFVFGLGLGFAPDEKTTASSSTTGSSFNVFQGFNFSSGSDADIALAVIAVLIVFGLLAILVSSVAVRAKVGYIHSTDFQTDNWNDVDGYHERYQVHRNGLELGLYFWQDIDLQLRFTVSHVKAFIDRQLAEDKEAYNAHGYSTGISIGWFPFPSHGGWFMYVNFEESVFTAGSYTEYLRKSNKLTDMSRRSAALVAGYSF